MNPPFIALCGAPGAGKTTVAEALAGIFGGQVIDDGLPLREAAMTLYGLSRDAVFTQAGKKRLVNICGETIEVRVLLGELGNMLEARHGERFLAERAIERARNQVGAVPPFFLFPSVRKTQGHSYLEAGGVVIEVSRPGHVPVNAFDRYDESAITHRLYNDGTEGMLIDEAIQLVEGLGFKPRRGRR
jgi:hypothetical protein